MLKKMENTIAPMWKNERQEALSKCLEVIFTGRINADRVCFNENCNAPVERFYERSIYRKSYKCTCCGNEFYLMRGKVSLDKHEVNMDDYYEIAFRQAARRKHSIEELTVVNIYKEYEYCYDIGYTILRFIKSEEYEYSSEAGYEIPLSIKRPVKNA